MIQNQLFIAFHVPIKYLIEIILLAENTGEYMKKIPQKDFKRFNMTKPPQKQKLLFLIRMLSYPAVKKHKSKITKIDIENLKPPYLLFVNHNAFLDFKVVSKATHPHRTNSIVAIDGFIGREWLMRMVGCICKRKFTKDFALIRHLKKVVDNKDIAVIYPEARYSLCGTNAVLPDSLGKLAKLLNVPVVTVINHGHHINSPFWNLKERGVHTETTMKCLFTKDEVKTVSSDEINQAIQKEFIYDDYKWQYENKVRVSYPKRAEGLHKVLYQCPNCNTEYKMASKGNKLSCSSCGKLWSMDEYGRLSADNGVTEFSHIPDWYEWERSNVKDEVTKGSYSLYCSVRVDSLPNSKGYINLGKATLTHNTDGFLLEGEYLGESYKVEKSVESMYSCHIEYNYLGKHGDCIDINTINDTFYIYPEGNAFSVTKVALATEELYKHKLGGEGIIM